MALREQLRAIEALEKDLAALSAENSMLRAQLKTYKQGQDLNHDLEKAMQRANIAEQIGKFGHVEIFLDSYSFRASKGAFEIMGPCEHEINSIDTVFERIHPDDRDKYIAHYTTALSQPGKSPAHLTVRFVLPDGTIKHVNTILLSYDTDSQIVIGVMQDVTEKVMQEKREQALQNQVAISDKMRSLGLLVSGITHDFNNILATIISGAEYFSLNEKLTEKEKTAALNIIDAGAHAASLTKQLLAFSRQNETPHTGVKLQDIIKATISLVRQTVDSRIAISTRHKADDLYIKTDYSRFQALILNVCVNADDALAEVDHPEIRITTDRIHAGSILPAAHNIDTGESEYALLRITNNGTPISKEIIDKIFDPFFTTKADTGGTGLGLSMVFSTIQSMKGRVFVDSSDGKETSFSFYMPLDRVTSEAPPDTHKIIPGHGSILFVDDDDNFRENAGFFLSHLGYEVNLCAGGAQALQLLHSRKKSYDLAIIDMIMPDMDGAELFTKIREFNTQLKVIMLSGQIGENPLPAHVSQGLSMRLSKPIHTAELSQAIHDVLS